VVTSFTYDFRNRLTSAESRSAGGVVLSASQFTYDVYDRLILRSVNGVSLATVYDGANPWADAVGGSISARYLYGDGADEILARWRSADGTAWYLADKQGTIRDLLDNSGSVVARRDFDSFGRILSSTGSVDRFAFQGREWEASVSLYQFRARWYDPLTRQFTTTDPLGFAAGDPNTRRFVSNNPMNGRDPSGMLAATEKSILLGAGVGAAIGALCSLGDMIALNDYSLNAWLNLATNTFIGASVGAGFSLLLVGTVAAQGAALAIGIGGLAPTYLERTNAFNAAMAEANRPGGSNGRVYSWIACTAGIVVGSAAGGFFNRGVAHRIVVAFVAELGLYGFCLLASRFPELWRILEKAGVRLLACPRLVWLLCRRRRSSLWQSAFVAFEQAFEDSDGGGEVVAEQHQEVDVVEIL
jgi:RHS repeat-associated protein